MLDLVYHKWNPHFTTVVDGRILQKIFKTKIEKNVLEEDIIFTWLLQL